MDGRARSDRAAGAILAAVGLVLVGWAGAVFVRYLPDLGSESEHLAGDASLSLLFVALPLVVAGLLSLLVAWLLWRGRPHAGALALGWVVVAGIVSAVALSAFGNALWAARTILLGPGTWLVRWPWFYQDPVNLLATGTPVENLPGARLDTIDFWIPGIIAVGALAVAGLLLAGRIAGRARGAGPG